jgi:hypothetical protein
MATLVETLAAVKVLIDSLVPGTLKAVLDGPQEDQLYEFPVGEVRFGPGSVGREIDARLLERRHQRTGIVRLWVARQQPLPGEAAKFAPLIDAVEAAFRDEPRLGGLADRFDATGNSGMLPDEQTNLLYVDVGWSATFAEPDTFVQDW